MTYPEAIVVGFIQGITELFPVSSLGHNVLIPALIGGSWAADLNVAASTSPYLAFIVGMHVATAIGLLIYFWRDWVRIIAAFFGSLKERDIRTADQKLAWMLIVATIPVGLVGLLFEHEFRVLFGKPVRAAIFLIINGVILYAGERFRTKRSKAPKAELEAERDARQGQPALRNSDRPGERAERLADIEAAKQSDSRLATKSFVEALVIGSAQVLALLAGISRDGVTIVAGMFGGLAREDAARFAFLLATPVILAAGVLKVPDLIKYGDGIYGQVLVGSVLSVVGAYVSVRFLMKYFQTRTLTPFAVYCVVFGVFCIVYLHFN